MCSPRWSHIKEVAQTPEIVEPNEMRSQFFMHQKILTASPTFYLRGVFIKFPCPSPTHSSWTKVTSWDGNCYLHFLLFLIQKSDELSSIGRTLHYIYIRYWSSNPNYSTYSL
jgi:hypothetical protein